MPENAEIAPAVTIAALPPIAPQAAQPAVAYPLAGRRRQEALVRRVRDVSQKHPSTVHGTLLAESSDPW